MATIGEVAAKCPVCQKPWKVRIACQLVPRHNRPGEAAAKVSVVKPIRVPREHRSCIGKVV